MFHGHEKERCRSLQASFPDLFPETHSKVPDTLLLMFQDVEFARSREVLLAKKGEFIKKYAKENGLQVARSITPSEEDLLFCTKHFGEHNPEVLQRTVWWVFSLSFGFRARDESRMLRWGNIAL